jgi:predicted short-subunit dehydrogenase-like oxidoreductase (DUF2520 family)
VRVFIFGSGKVGRGLAEALGGAGWPVELRAARDGLPATRVTSPLLVLALRDSRLGPTAEELARRRLVGAQTACVHVAGALGPEILAPLRQVCAGVAQMHPMISFADPDAPPTLERGTLHVSGDPVAVRRAYAVAKALGMTARTIDGLDRVGYHAAAALLANGGAALAGIAARLLVRSGVAEADAPRLLGPLLRSVADNVERLGMPAALTGPVRRGDAAAVRQQVELLRRKAPDAVSFFLAAGRAQIPFVRALAEVPVEMVDAIEAVLAEAEKAP